MRESISSWSLQGRWGVYDALRKREDFNRQKKGKEHSSARKELGAKGKGTW